MDQILMVSCTLLYVWYGDLQIVIYINPYWIKVRVYVDAAYWI
jgi:hypothetical protein